MKKSPQIKFNGMVVKMKKSPQIKFNGHDFFTRDHNKEFDRDVFNEVIMGDCYKIDLIKNIYIPKVIADVGAHIGTFSLLARKIWPNSSIYAIEPEPENVELLKANLSFYQNTHVIDGAIAYSENKTLFLGTGSTGGNYIYDSSHQPNSQYTKFEKPISLYRLSEVVPFVDCLKMDCEGGEYELLEQEDKEFLSKIEITFGEYHRNINLFKKTIEQAMPHMRMFYTGPGNTQPTTEAVIGNFWGFNKEMQIPEYVLKQLEQYKF